MNKSYMCINDKVIVSDEKGRQTMTDYSDNLDQILVEENLIESILIKINDLEKQNKIYKKINKRKYIPYTILLATFSIFFIFPIFFYLLDGSNMFNNLVSTRFGLMSEMKALCFSTATAALPLTLLLDLVNFIKYKIDIKKEKGINSELEYLNEQLKKERHKLKKLFDNRTKNNISKNIKTTSVNDVKQLKELNEQEEFYYDIGYNEEKYYKYYIKGILDKKMNKHYSDSSSLASEYFENQGPSLVKKKTLKKFNK